MSHSEFSVQSAELFCGICIMDGCEISVDFGDFNPPSYAQMSQITNVSVQS